MGSRVTQKSHPHWDWKKTPKGTYIISELIQSDAYRELSKTQSDIWLFLLTGRSYPRRKKGQEFNHWNPNNRDHMKCPYVKINDFFDGTVRGMAGKSPSNETIRKAFIKFMHVGFLSVKKAGGNGPGDQNIYQLENNWRLWKKGDPPCFEKAGLSRERGFCKPGSGTFYGKNRAQNQKRGQPPSDLLHSPASD